MSAITFHRATSHDIAALAVLRISFLSELSGPQESAVAEKLRLSLIEFFTNAFREQTYLAWLAKDGDTIVSAGGMALWRHPGNFINPEGRKGYIMNMYTVPSRRRRGICTEILNLLIDMAREMGVNSFELHATNEGEPVYVKAGFKLHSEPTYRKHYF